jgi:hypothetical protein
VCSGTKLSKALGAAIHSPYLEPGYGCGVFSAAWSFCLYMRQGARIICEDRKDDQSDMKWVKRFVIFLVVGFALFYLIANPEGAANAVRAVINALAVVLRSIIIFFQSLVS